MSALAWAKLDLHRLRLSSTYRNLKPGPERALAVVLWAHASQFGPIPDEEAELGVAGCGHPAAEVRAFLPRAGFTKEGPFWVNEHAAEYYAEGLAASGRQSDRAKRKAELARLKRESALAAASATAPATAPAASLSLSLSVVEEAKEAKEEGFSSKVTKEGEVVDAEFALVPYGEPVIEAPIRTASRIREAATAFLHARHLRCWGERRPFHPSAGLVGEIARRLEDRIKDGFDPNFLVSLPALVDEEAIDFMLKKDAEVLLRDDNAHGGKCHARRYESRLPDIVVRQRQANILKRIGTWDWIKVRVRVTEGVE